MVYNGLNLLVLGGFVLQTGLVIIDGWLKMAAPAQTAVLFKELRLTLHSILEELIRKPQVCYISAYGQVLVYILVELKSNFLGCSLIFVTKNPLNPDFVSSVLGFPVHVSLFG